MEPIVHARDLKIHYPLFKGFVQRILGGGSLFVRAVDGITFDIRPGEVFGLVGESGCGKTTTGRCLLGLTPITAGEVRLRFSRLSGHSPKFVRPLGIALACFLLWTLGAAYVANAWVRVVPPLGAFASAVPEVFFSIWVTLAAVQGIVAVPLWRMDRRSRRPMRLVAIMGALLSLLTIPWGLAPLALYGAIFTYLGTPGPLGLIRRSGLLAPADAFVLRPEGIAEGTDDPQPPSRAERWLVGPRAVPTGGFSWVVKLLREKVQIVYQDPHASLNPALTIGEQLEHAIAAHPSAIDLSEDVGPNAGDRTAKIRKRALQLLDDVGLRPPEQFYAKLPGEISGGQKQRVVIARAIAPRPSLLVADEPVALLDMSIRAKVLELMFDLKRKYGLTYVFITHDLATAKLMCDRIAIMYLGRIVEMGESRRIYADPKHPYTRALLQAIPIPDPRKKKEKLLPKGEVPDAVNPPLGCRFHPRCPVALPSCGWEGRDFLAYLEERRLDPARAKAEEETFGSLEDWEVAGLVARRLAPDSAGLAARVRAILGEAPQPLAQAVADVRAEGGEIIVLFREPALLQPKEVEGRSVECLLY